MGDHSILAATLDTEKIGKTFHHALKHGTNLVWLASDDPANRTSSVIL